MVRYPRAFEVVPPFGVEHFHATAFEERPPPLSTRPQRIAGELYEVVVSGDALPEAPVRRDPPRPSWR